MSGTNHGRIGRHFKQAETPDLQLAGAIPIIFIAPSQRLLSEAAMLIWLIFVADRRTRRSWSPGFRSEFGVSGQVWTVSRLRTEGAEERKRSGFGL